MKNDNGQVRFPPPGRTPREDTAAVMKFYRLPPEFPAEVRDEARRVADALEKPGDRLDLRNRFIFTCDPATARDYDDALSFETDRWGNRVLGVHIADVSHFVRPGSALDREAYKRSTSVYFCDRVVPMLPEELSNGVCSLVPNEDRLAFSVFMTFDKSGEMIKREFFKTVIRSKARFTYEQVMSVIGGGSVAGFWRGRKPIEVDRTVRSIAALAAQLRERRFAAGALDLAVPEAEVMLAENGEMTGIELRENDESHQMIEECMVAANEAVAKELWSNGIKILARLHEPPDEEKLIMLRSELRGLGVKLGNIGIGKRVSCRIFSEKLTADYIYPRVCTLRRKPPHNEQLPRLSAVLKRADRFGIYSLQTLDDECHYLSFLSFIHLFSFPSLERRNTFPRVRRQEAYKVSRGPVR